MAIGAKKATESTLPASAYSMMRVYSRFARSLGERFAIFGGVAPPPLPPWANGAAAAPAPSTACVGSEFADPSMPEPLAAPKFLPATMATRASNATNATPHGRIDAVPPAAAGVRVGGSP